MVKSTCAFFCDKDVFLPNQPAVLSGSLYHKSDKDLAQCIRIIRVHHLDFHNLDAASQFYGKVCLAVVGDVHYVIQTTEQAHF